MLKELADIIDDSSQIIDELTAQGDEEGLAEFFARWDLALARNAHHERALAARRAARATARRAPALGTRDVTPPSWR